MIKRNIPNAITLMNLISGLMGIVFVIKGQVDIAIYMVFLASIFDFMDGSAARLLKAYSDVGKSLDSLCDMVSFGVLPGVIVYSIATQSLNVSSFDSVAFAALLIPVFGAIRLAVFDNDESQTDSFRGVPIPASAIFIASLSRVFWYETDSFIALGPAGFFGIAIGFSILQVVFIPMLSFKFKSLGFKQNFSRYLMLITGLLLIITFGWEGILISMIVYLLISIFTLRKK